MCTHSIYTLGYTEQQQKSRRTSKLAQKITNIQGRGDRMDKKM